MSDRGKGSFRYYHWPDALIRRNVSLVSCVLIYYEGRSEYPAVASPEG
ncbi:MAG: hypothetical protein IID18_00670 [Nitrospinae bacterium]|nr:hypothetical protein [Nitrospinota bacterium]